MTDTNEPVLKHRLANLSDTAWLAEWNHQLIQDESHRNTMTVPELEMRMRRWLSGEYQAMVFEHENQVVAYALFRTSKHMAYLRHFFVHRHHRGKGVGHAAVRTLLTKIWPPDLRVAVEVLTHNERARKFWSDMGFGEYSVTMELLPDARP